MTQVTRAILARLLADEVDGLTVQMAAASVDALADIITEVLAAQGTLKIANLGTLGVRSRAERHTFHPRTGEPVTIPAAKVPYFQASAALKARINRA